MSYTVAELKEREYQNKVTSVLNVYSDVSKCLNIYTPNVSSIMFATASRQLKHLMVHGNQNVATASRPTPGISVHGKHMHTTWVASV